MAIDPDLAPTTPAAITPTNPGNFSSIRSAPILTQPRYFNPAEAASIRQAAAQKQQQVGSTKSAYKGLKQIEKAVRGIPIAEKDSLEQKVAWIRTASKTELARLLRLVAEQLEAVYVRNVAVEPQVSDRAVNKTNSQPIADQLGICFEGLTQARKLPPGKNASSRICSIA
jgi:hypothetical protein